METSLVAVEVRVHGRPIKEYLHKGMTFVEGRKGSTFTLHIRNKSWQRLLVVPSIDGLSVMDGKEASFSSSGYVLDAGGSVDIPGWRLDDKQVAKFFFSEAAKAYAKQTGKPRNVGVIGVAVFAELPLPYTLTSTGGSFCDPARWVYKTADPLYTVHWGNTCTAGARGTSAHAANPDVSAHAALFNACSNEVGTGFGEAAEHQVSYTDFRRPEVPNEGVEIFYDTREGLVRRGVDLRVRPAVSRPNPFPKQHGFCTPPPGWRGGR